VKGKGIDRNGKRVGYICRRKPSYPEIRKGHSSMKKTFRTLLLSRTGKGGRCLTTLRDRFGNRTSLTGSIVQGALLNQPESKAYRRKGSSSGRQVTIGPWIFTKGNQCGPRRSEKQQKTANGSRVRFIQFRGGKSQIIFIERGVPSAEISRKGLQNGKREVRC